MKAYVINLKERTDRWDTFQENWKNIDLDFVRVDAFKMENVYHAVFYKHRELLQQAKNRGETHLLVMEDDAMPCVLFKKRFEYIKEYLDPRNDWDVMNGGMLAIRDCITKIVKIKQPDLSTLLLNATRGCMAHFLYFKVDNVLEKIKDWEVEGKPEFDAWYSNKLNCLASIPYLAIQSDGISDATKDERKWEERFKFEELDLMYRLRDFL
jgi:hypothetical protein